MSLVLTHDLIRFWVLREERIGANQDHMKLCVANNSLDEEYCLARCEDTCMFTYITGVRNSNRWQLIYMRKYVIIKAGYSNRFR